MNPTGLLSLLLVATLELSAFVATSSAQGRGGPPPIKSPDISADQRVTFRLRAPNAKEVAVSLAGKQLPMQKDAEGVWSLTTEPMTPDIYAYTLVVDGASISDPSNRQAETSFTGFRSMFMVPGGAAPWLPAPGVPRGAIARHAFHSNVANDDRDFFVYTPPGYDARRSQPYPVLYLLHGLGDDAERWMNGGAANHILDNLIAQKKAVPMVVVTPLGYGVAGGPAGAFSPDMFPGYAKILLEEVMPAVDKAYNVTKNREQRAIAGLSMGGAETLYVGLNNLDKFAWLGAFSSAQVMWNSAVPNAANAAGRGAGGVARGAGAGRGAGAPPPMDEAVFAKMFPNLDAKANSRLRMLWITCGTADSLIGVNRQFKGWLKSKGVAFTELETPDVGHVWPYWRQNLAEMVPQLFQSK
jgi:enterochelin esterase family protein